MRDAGTTFSFLKFSEHSCESTNRYLLKENGFNLTKLPILLFFPQKKQLKIFFTLLMKRFQRPIVLLGEPLHLSNAHLQCPEVQRSDTGSELLSLGVAGR